MEIGGKTECTGKMGDDIRANSTCTCERTESKQLLRTARKLCFWYLLCRNRQRSEMKYSVVSFYMLHLKWGTLKSKMSLGKFIEPFFFLVFFCFDLLLDCDSSHNLLISFLFGMFIKLFQHTLVLISISPRLFGTFGLLDDSLMIKLVTCFRKIVMNLLDHNRTSYFNLGMQLNQQSGWYA